MINRNEINENDKWDLSFLFANEEEYAKTINAIEIKTKEFKKYEKLELNFDLFKETLNKYYEIMEDLEKVSYYAMLQLETDVTNKDSNKIYSICVNLATKVSNTTSYFMPKILKTDE
ncbi:oligoendopeptidase F, partial [Borreliella burgdorferi 29805]